jgi:biotin operon repressor
MAARLEPMEREAAAARLQATQAKSGQRIGEHIGSENFSEPMKGRALDKVANALDTSRPTLKKAVHHSFDVWPFLRLQPF